MKEKNVNAGTRLASMLLDHVIMTFAMMIFAIPGMINAFGKALNVSHEPSGIDLFGDTVYIMLIGFAVYWCKDSINGRSPGKRITNLQVVDNVTGITASPVKCFVRNIFLFFWPLEVIVTLINPSRRLGDLVAGTKVAQYEAAINQQKVNWPGIVVSLALAYGIMLLAMLPYNIMRSNFKNQKIDYIESSFNESESSATEQLFADHLKSKLDADVRVYDKIESGDLKYVSIIFRMEDNYLLDEEAFEQLKSKTIALTLTKFPEKTFIGRFQYIYRRGGNAQSREITLDWREPGESE